MPVCGLCLADILCLDVVHIFESNLFYQHGREHEDDTRMRYRGMYRFGTKTLNTLF